MPVAAFIAAVLAYNAGGLAGVLILAALATAAYHQRARLAPLLRRLPVLPGRRSSRPGGAGEAGASSFARARALRTPWVRLLTAVGIVTEAEKLARRCHVGGLGEQEAARLLAPLTAEGWTLLYDRKLPRGNANIDGLAISPKGHVYLLDPKKRKARLPLSARGGRLFQVERDVTWWLDGVRYATHTVSTLLGVKVTALVLMIGPLAPGQQLHAASVRIIPAADAAERLRALDAARYEVNRGPQFVANVRRLLPSYTGS